ncbi:MAG: dTMP kinase [Magnetococcales bacterium]|nr:dTMP kinase [Magnetococcales bacterium]
MAELRSGSGAFLTLEGGEGAGKSTQVMLLAERLAGCGVDVVVTREPGGCPFAEQLRALLVSGPPEGITAKTELLLMTAARVEHVRQVIQPALDRGRWVVCDRFFDSTWAYQGCGRGMDVAFLESLHRWSVGELVPDLTLFVALDVEYGLQRSGDRLRNRSVENRFEAEDVSFHQRVQDGFRELASRNPERIRIIDGHSSREAVAMAIWREVTGVFPHLE